MKYSEITVKICDLFRKIADQKGQFAGMPAMPEKSQQMDFEEYLLACRELLGTDVPLTDEILYGNTDTSGNYQSMGRLNYLKQDSKLKMHLPEGYRCCIVVIPCSQYGFPLEADDVKNGHYVRALIVDENDMAVMGHTFNASTLFKKLPKEMQEKCTFKIPKYEKEGIYEITDGDRKNIMDLYEQTYKAAQKLLNQAAERAVN
jgi:hypothetical protein